jgi:pyruvate/2-oxoglutarate dehydrogenase complex dihydrolipoamide dehydrogenase (E3) component
MVSCAALGGPGFKEECNVEERHVDVAIIGSGTAGLNAMGQVRRAGKSFVLINGGEPGTTCARVGCMPSKAMIQVAEDYHRRTHLGKYGIDGHEAMTLDVTGGPGACAGPARHLRRPGARQQHRQHAAGSLHPGLRADFLEPNLVEVAGSASAPGPW